MKISNFFKIGILVILLICITNVGNSFGQEDDTSQHVPYRYLENDGISIYYETDNRETYQSLLPDEFDMPDRLLVYAFITDFYKIDNGATPYKENALFILADYQGEEIWHCVYMPVTDEHSMWAGILGLGLPKTLGEIEFTRDDPVYSGVGTNPLGGTMSMSVNTNDYVISEAAKEELLALSQLRYLNIRNEKVIEMGKTSELTSVIEIAEKYPNLLTLKFGEGSISMESNIAIKNHPLDLTPTNIIGAYYSLNKIPFGLTGNSN